jgi:hypothetical protein
MGGPMRRWLASFERMLDEDEKEQSDKLEEEFLNWAKEKLTDLEGFRNVRTGKFERSNRIMSVDVEFDHPDKMFPASIPTFDNWVVIQVKRFNNDFQFP